MNRRSFLSRIVCTVTSILASGHVLFCTKKRGQGKKPNIIWIVADGMSPHWSCYGETTIQTPCIDRLANEGIRFNRAFATSSLSSPSFSALFTGYYQTRMGSHHHPSQRNEEEGAGDSLYQSSYHVPVKSIPERFQDVGYFTVLAGNGRNVDEEELSPKLDCNFIWDENIYDGDDWFVRGSDQPFFAQIQLAGGKGREAQVTNPVNPNDVQLPPYYPDHPVLREDWARYLNSIIQFDLEVGKIMDRLSEEGIEDNTIVFVFSVNGMNHLRGKQFLYDEGIRVPFIIWGPKTLSRGKVNNELVSLIDVSATSLAIAGIPVPDGMDSRSLLGGNQKKREFIAAAVDRCDETVDCIRCIRTENVKYIRNYFADRTYIQPNQARDSLQITQTMKDLLQDGQLLPMQSQIFSENRPPEELYIFYEDLYELNNLAPSRRYSGLLNKMRQFHLEWMRESRDLGLIPEPILEEMGKEYGNKYFVLRDDENQHLIDDILEVIELGEGGELSLIRLSEKLSHSSPAVRFRAAYAIGNIGIDVDNLSEKLHVLLKDSSASVRMAAARALCLMGFPEESIPVLRHELKSSANHALRHYAALFFDDIGEMAKPYLADFKLATQDRYDSVRQVAQRLVAKFENI